MSKQALGSVEPAAAVELDRPGRVHQSAKGKVEISTVGGRKRLPIDPDHICYAKRAVGRYVGFRRTGTDEKSGNATGSWWARLRDGDGKQHYRQLGDFADLPDAKRFDAACSAAEGFFGQAAAGASLERITVADACRDYVKNIRRTNAEKADRTDKDFVRLVYGDPIARIELSKVKQRDFDGWRDRIAERPAKVGKGQAIRGKKAPATVNREIVPLRAALNRALAQGEVVSDLPWRLALKPIKNADRPRTLELTREQRQALIEHAQPDFRAFLRALCVLPVRVGALAAMRVEDFNARTQSLRVGKDKAGADRWIPLPKATATFVGAQTVDKLPTAPLFETSAGGHWDRILWKRRIKAAAQGAKLPPTTTAYTLRHSVLNDLIIGGLDLFTVATLAGTSVAMLEANYGHLRRGHAAAALARLAL